jgi:hypothetical protein
MVSLMCSSVIFTEPLVLLFEHLVSTAQLVELLSLLLFELALLQLLVQVCQLLYSLVTLQLELSFQASDLIISNAECLP